MTDKEEPIQQAHRDQMNALAHGLDKILNGDDYMGNKTRRTCFVLLVAPFDTTEGRVNYISNGQRSDIINVLKELLSRWEREAESR